MATMMYRWHARAPVQTHLDLALVQRSRAASWREFSSSTHLRHDQDRAGFSANRPRPSQPESDRLRGSARTPGRAPTHARQTTRSPPTAEASNAEASNTSFRITRHYVDHPAPSSSSSPSSPTTSTRLFDARSLGASRPQGQRLELSPEVRARIEANRRARGAAASGAGRLLRTTRGQGAASRGAARPDNRLRRRREASSDDDDEENDATEQEDTDARIEARLAPPKRQWLDHKPEELSLEDLRVDWPALPTGQIGMVEGVQEKLRWMARRMQHGYDTPLELAERMQEGEMVHFESETEKEQALMYLKRLVEKRAADLTDRRGEEVEVEEAGFKSIVDAERWTLAEELVRGVYPTPGGGEKKQKRRYAFLDEVARVLGNNETYHASEQGQLLQTIHKLLPAPKKQQVLQKLGK